MVTPSWWQIFRVYKRRHHPHIPLSKIINHQTHKFIHFQLNYLQKFETTAQTSSPQQITPVPMGNIISVMSLFSNLVSDMALSTIVYSMLVTCLCSFVKAVVKDFAQPGYSCTTSCPEMTFDVWCDHIGDMIIIGLCAMRLFVWCKNCLSIFFHWLNPLHAAESLQVANHQHQHQHQNQH